MSYQKLSEIRMACGTTVELYLQDDLYDVQVHLVARDISNFVSAACTTMHADERRFTKLTEPIETDDFLHSQFNEVGIYAENAKDLVRTLRRIAGELENYLTERERS